MIQSMIDYLVQNQEVVQHLKKGTVSLIGLSEIEMKAVLEVFKDTNSYSPMNVWQ